MANLSLPDRLQRIQHALSHSDEPMAVKEMLAVRGQLGSEHVTTKKLAMAAQAIDRNDVALSLLERLPNERATQLYRLKLRLELGEAVADDIARWNKTRPYQPDALLLWVEALHAENRNNEAITILQDALKEQPGWIAGHQNLARLRWSSGDGQHCCDSFAFAHQQAAFDDAMWASWMSTLMTANELSAAQQVYGAATKASGPLLLAHMVAADCMSMAGDHAMADALFAQCQHIENADFTATQMRHAMRCQRYDAAIALGEALLAKVDHGECWAWLSAAWRLTDHPKWSWFCPGDLHMSVLDMDMSADDLQQLASILRQLHESSKFAPLGQSPRGGTQTMGPLFRRQEPMLRKLRTHLFDAVRSYISALPTDQHHPFLKRKSHGFRFAGAWSIRLGQAGFHVPHVHSHGWISSAFYVSLPQTLGGESGQDGWLELGIPQLPANSELAAVKSVEPRAARLALFPSMMWHGTRPFSDGERLTVAFDVTPA